MSFVKQDLTMPTKPGKYQVPRKMNKSHSAMVYYLTDELKEKFIKLFPIKDNREIMDLFGISFSTMQRFKRKLGLQKDMQKCRKRLVRKIKATCERNGYYDSLRGKSIPHAKKMREAFVEKYGEGFSASKRLKEISPSRYRRYLRKKSEMRKEMIRKERRRVELYMSRQTNIHLPYSNYSIRDRTIRTYAKKHGYIPGSKREEYGERYVIYYDENTERRPVFEANLRKSKFELRNLNEEKGEYRYIGGLG